MSGEKHTPDFAGRIYPAKSGKIQTIDILREQMEAGYQPSDRASITRPVLRRVLNDLEHGIQLLDALQNDRARAVRPSVAPQAIAPAEDIADAVLKWMVDGGFIDADNEYHASDIVSVLNDLLEPSIPPAAPTDGDIGALVERLMHRASTMNGVTPVGAGDGNTYAVGYYGPVDRKLDNEAATALAAMSAKLAEVERERDNWCSDFRALQKALVGESGLSAITVAAGAKANLIRAESAEGKMAEAEQREETWRMEVATAEAANADLRRRVDAMDKALQEIADQHLHNIALDPGWPQRIARAARASGGSDA